MPQRKLPDFFIQAFYESKFRGNLFIIKAGGKIIEDKTALDTLIADIKTLTAHGIKVALIYGGGRAIDEACDANNVETIKHQGRRVTTLDTLNIMKGVLGGHLSLNVYETMARHNLEGISLNAVPPSWLDVSLRPKDPIDFGYVGDIHQAHARPLNRMLKTADFVAVPCLVWADDAKTLCNINADTVATQLAIATGANKLVFLSDIDGVNIDGETALMITAEDVPNLIAQGKVTGGMQVKLENCKTALEQGVKRIHLINGFRERALYNEIFSSTGPGTMLITEDERQSYMNEIEAQKVLQSA